MYLWERRALIETEQNQSLQYDKAILTLSAGALGVTVVFVHEIAPAPDKDTLHFLFGGWAAFALSILSTLFSFLSSQAAHRQQRDSLDREIATQRRELAKGHLEK